MPRGIKLDLGDTTLPEERMIRLPGIALNVTNKQINEFFEGYEVIDWKRRVENTNNSNKAVVVYALMSSLNEVKKFIRQTEAKPNSHFPHQAIRAQTNLDNQVLHNRNIPVQRVQGGNICKSFCCKLTLTDHTI